MLTQSDVVKPGDEIAVYSSSGGNGYYSIATVAKVTPSLGQIVLADGRRFSKMGDMVGERTKWSSTTLHILTDVIRADIARKGNVRYLESVEWRKLDNATLAQVADLLKRRQISPEQEQEMRERVRRFYRNQPAASPEVAAIALSSFVFEDGRRGESVSLQTRLQIASEEKH